MICRPAAVRLVASRATSMATRRAFAQGAPSLSTLAGRQAFAPATSFQQTTPTFRLLSTAAVQEEPAAAAPSAPKVEKKTPFVPTPERLYENFENVEVTPEGVAIVRFDCANQSVNTISFAVADEAKKLWANEIENNDNVKAVVFDADPPPTHHCKQATEDAAPL